MNLREIVKLLDAHVVLGEEHLNEEVQKVFASDLMSDVLTQTEEPLLITGLCNVQTIRTCDMAGITHLLLVRNKKPGEDMLELAEECGMVVLTCNYSMFRTCGLLYEAGLKPLF